MFTEKKKLNTSYLLRHSFRYSVIAVNKKMYIIQKTDNDNNKFFGTSYIDQICQNVEERGPALNMSAYEPIFNDI